jgi:aspartyl-tRNA(Asn)/glutamyl-tRNA(Gln) amidotransferase subunit B
MEIVSEPVIRSAEEAYAYLTSLRATMIYGGISDCDMEKGQLRCDANISIRPVGATELGTKVELKNLNSISFVRDGIDHEIKRQIAVVKAGGTIVQETRDYDGMTGASQSLRSKEMAHDYRYFPDPDLMPVKVDAAWKSRLQGECPELPFDKQRRFMEEYGLPYTITSVLVWDRDLAAYFEEAVQSAGRDKAQAVGNWIVNDLLRELGAAKVSVAESKIRPQHVAALVKLIDGDDCRPAGSEGGTHGRRRTRTVVPRCHRGQREGSRRVQGRQGQRHQRIQGPGHEGLEGQGQPEAR